MQKGRCQAIPPSRWGCLKLSSSFVILEATEYWYNQPVKRLAVVYFPSINLEEINKFRQKYDPNWNIIKPHITLISPISDVPKDLFQHIETIAKGVKSLPINLNGLTKSFDNYLFLQVKEGNHEVIELHNKLYSGILAPYLKSDIPFSPHLTIGYFGTENNELNKELYEKAYAEAKEMNINIDCNFDNLTLIEGNELAPAKIIKTFNLN